MSQPSDPLDVVDNFLDALLRRENIEPLDVTTIYGTGQKRVQIAVGFAATCVASKAWSLLEGAWSAADVTRMEPAVMLGLLCGTWTKRTEGLLPGREAYVERCKAEMTRRGLPDKVSLFDRP